MKINIARFYRQERMELDCEVVTPMFLGNASQNAELRAAPFKGLLRYWWRVAHGGSYNKVDLLQEENKIFGSADADSGGKSRVVVEVQPLSSMVGKKDKFPNPGLIDHPECEKNKPKFKTNPLSYLAGMGLIHHRKGIQHSYFPAGAEFRFLVICSQEVSWAVKQTLGLMQQFVAIGSRSRNGWGCFSIKPKYPFSFPMKHIDKAFDRDYPHCLSKDINGNLFWRTKNNQDSWEQCMKKLAEVYVSIRAGNPQKGLEKMEVNTGPRPDRHLLGYPVTNHPVARWKKSRHGSALRLLVRKEADGHRGYILHLPHLFSEIMWPKSEKERQIQIWKTVHKKLDTLCERVPCEEEASR